MTHASMTLVALLNAMIGGIILVLPMLFKSAGILPSFLSTLLTALFSYYSCKICYDHLKEGEDMPQALFRHTKSKLLSRLYDGLMWLSYLFSLLLYFNLIVDQWRNLLSSGSLFITASNGLILIVLVILMEKFDFGVNLLAYGIVSIVSYVLFLCWALYDSRNLEKTNEMPIFSWNFSTLCDTLNTGLNVQGIFIPLLNKNFDPQLNNPILILLFTCGFLIYASIGFIGAYAILNRKVFNHKIQTIQKYFKAGQIPVMSISIIYLVHLYSVFPEYLIISQKLMFDLFGWNIEEKWKDRVYASILILLFCVVNTAGISIELILAANGTALGFLFVYAMPIFIHIKCQYFLEEFSMDRCRRMNVVEQIVHLLLMSVMLVFGVAIFVYSVKSIMQKYV